MSALTVLTSEIRQHDGLYSLNDLHKAAGGARKHQPCNFMRVDTTQALIEEIRTSDLRIIPTKTIRGRGKPQGTYACKELVYAYAMWVSPSFHLKVIRAFDAMQQPVGNPDTLPTPNALRFLPIGEPGQRVLIRFESDGSYAAMPVPSGCYVLTLEQIAKGVGIGQDLPFSSAQLGQIIEGASRRLNQAFLQPAQHALEQSLVGGR